MDEMTQQNSALVEENAASSRMLQDQAETMHQRMANFTLPEPSADTRMASRTVTPIRSGTVSSAPAKPQPKRQAVRKVAAGGAARLQENLRSTFENDSDWAEF
jgi:methyl-accepting chemotaxis protein